MSAELRLFQKQRIDEAKERIFLVTCLSFCGLGLVTKSLCQIFMNSAEEFWQRWSRKHVFCENWLSGGYTLQSFGPICLTIECCPETSVTNYHSSLHKIPLEHRSHKKFIFSATADIILAATRMLQSCLDGVV